MFSLKITKYLLLTSLIFSGFINPAWSETVLITGANRNIGLEFASQYAEKGWQVIATHRRDVTPESLIELESKFDNVRAERMDITDHSSVLALAQKLTGQAIDVLVNNAGYGGDFRGPSQQLGSLNYDDFELVMRTNGLGALMVSEAFLEHVSASKRKIILGLSSTLASLAAGPADGGAYWYRMAKTALHQSIVTMAKDLESDGITVAAISPGRIYNPADTDHNKMEPGMVAMDDSIAALIEMIDTMNITDTGSFILYDGQKIPW
jgi:NAD(P)-dependent dehydrogenase (short-subunit alcohol dehydrogenase family)